MKPLNNKDRLEELMKKYLAREHTRAEADEMLDLLRFIHKPDMLEDFFQDRWDIEDRPEAQVVWEDVLQARENRRVAEHADKRRLRIKPQWKWSAVASLLLLITFLWWNLEDQSEFVTYTTGYGETQEILLEDGTEITLNANSELHWNKNWKSDKVRYAELKGEAFFDVSHVDVITGKETLSKNLSQRLPFHVKSAGVMIEVLGTSFNVEERRGETRVYLKEGSVKLNLLEKEVREHKTGDTEKETNTSHSAQTVLMEPGETVQYSTETREWVILEVDLASPITEWKDGILLFEDVRFGDMLQQMEDIYGKIFEVKDADLLDRQVNFAVPYENWETIEKLMGVTLRLEFEKKNDDNITIKNRKE